jgi:hypothetical protein
MSMNAVEEALTVVDTLLLRVYLIINEALVGPLLRVSNHCLIEEAERLLAKHAVRPFPFKVIVHLLFARNGRT